MRRRKKTLTIVIPVYNERDRIHLAIDALNAYDPPECLEIERIVFVDDGSEDDTLGALQAAEIKYPSEVVTYHPNRGRGYAVRAGMKEAETDYAMYLDADMSIPLDNLRNFASRMREGVDLLVGSKKMKETVCFQKRSLLRKIVGWGHSAIFSFVLGVRMHDFQGGFKVFSRRTVRGVLSRARIDRWGMDAEAIFLAGRRDLSVEEIPVVWGHVERGTKVSLARDILRAFKELAQIRWNHVCGRYRSVSDPVNIDDVAAVYELQTG
jgi:dolichyl-phosphate beta-glucosyltransferase